MTQRIKTHVARATYQERVARSTERVSPGTARQTGEQVVTSLLRGAMATLGGTQVFRAGFSVAMLAGKVLLLS